jgi:hypothetical protein
MSFYVGIEIDDGNFAINVREFLWALITRTNSKQPVHLLGFVDLAIRSSHI